MRSTATTTTANITAHPSRATMNRNSVIGGGVPLGNNTGVVIGNVQKQQQQHKPSHLMIGHQKLQQSTTPPSSNGSSVGGALDNLPKQFVSSMRTLFDIMDDKRTGFVRLSDIEHRWQDDGSKGLPPGVIDSLRRVTPASGLLSFERFCAGLKICLLKSQSEGKGSSSRRSSTSAASSDSNNNTSRPPSAPLLDLDHAPLSLHNGNQWNANNTAAVRPNNALPNIVQRTLSLPKLSPGSDGNDSGSDRYSSPTSIYAAPPKPPRTALLTNNGTTNINHLDRFDKAEIRHALQNWQMNVLMNEMEAKDKRRAVAIPNSVALMRGSADGSSPNGGGIYSNGGVPLPLPPPPPLTHAQLQEKHKQQQKAIAVALQQQQQQKKQNNRRREPRRHTLQNGIDYNMLKRMKHYEDEKEVLLQGLAAVEKAQEWYFKQLAIVDDKIKYLGRIESHSEPWTEATQERLDLQRARVHEVNRHLSVLADSWEHGGFPFHMNLAVRHHGPMLPQYQDALVNRLKVQNQQLADEVHHKNERIASLEIERKSIYRDLMQQQRMKNNILTGNEEVIF